MFSLASAVVGTFLVGNPGSNAHIESLNLLFVSFACV